MLAMLKRRLHEFVTRVVRTELNNHAAAVTEKAPDRKPGEVTDLVTKDPLTHHALASAASLAEGVATAYAVDIEGDVAEFGTMTGYTSFALARAILNCEARLQHAMQVYQTRPKQLHLFDSFSGLPEITSERDRSSPHVSDGAWSPGACSGLSESELRAHVESSGIASDRVTTFSGWFATTVPDLANDVGYCVVHIDCDLYQSTVDVLTNLFSGGHVRPGCHIFFDDWNCNRADPNYGERKAWAEAVEQFEVLFSDRGSYGLFGRCFIVHAYKSVAPAFGSKRAVGNLMATTQPAATDGVPNQIS